MSLAGMMAAGDQVAPVAFLPEQRGELFAGPPRRPRMKLHVDARDAGPEIVGHGREALVLRAFAVELQEIAPLDRMVREEVAERRRLDPDRARPFRDVAQDRVAAGIGR